MRDDRSYGASMEKEPVLEKTILPGGAGEMRVTRCRYGSKILNIGNVMFVDVDTVPESRENCALNDHDRLQAEAGALDNLTYLMEDEPDYGAAVYRTKKGLRYLFTSGVFDPRSREVEDIMAQLGADDLYALICHGQNCFRARVSPKPWRCGAGQHPHFNFPYDWKYGSGKHTNKYTKWIEEYTPKANEFATCHLMCSVGAKAVSRAVAPVLRAHDDHCRVRSKLALA